MERLNNLIKEHYLIDTKRSSLSNLIKKIKLDNELYSFIDNYQNYGTFKQKFYNFTKNFTKEPLCPVCNINKLNWVENNSVYRSTCSTKCNGKLTGTKNNPKKELHPSLETKQDYINYFNLSKIKLTESNLKNVYPDLVKEISSLPIKFPDRYVENVYYYLYELKNVPICKYCNYSTVKFDTFLNGYHDYCSVKCSSNSTEKKNAIINTCLTKYGVKNIGEITRNKANETMNERYGGHISTTEQYKNKYKETSMINHGFEHPSKSDIIKYKIKNSLIERYGNDYIKKIISETLKTKIVNGTIYKWTETELKDIQSYRRSVSYYTELTYKENIDILNPDNLERGIFTNHLDHIFPVIEGWKNKICPKLISNLNNLKLVSSYENLSKGERTKMTVEDFYISINNI